jgi:hypothetical protein
MYTLCNVTQKFSKVFFSLSIHYRTYRKEGKVILFKPQEKCGLLCTSSYETHKCQQSYTRIFHTQGQVNRRKCVESKDRDALNPLNAELNSICHLLILLGDLTFMSTCIVSIFQYISNKMQSYTVYLYLETTLNVSGGTFTHHQERIHLYLQHLVFVTPLLLSHSTLKLVPTLPR